MTRLEITPVEHGLAVLVAFSIATLLQVGVSVNLVPGAVASRHGIAWCLSDAIPTAVALGVLGSRPFDAKRALAAAFLVELAALASLVGIEATTAHVGGSSATFHAIFVDVVGGLYASHAGVIAAYFGRAAALLLATRAKGSLLEGAALGVPLGASWAAMHVLAGPFEAAELGGPIAFALGSTLLVPILERWTVRAFRALGVTETPP